MSTCKRLKIAGQRGEEAVQLVALQTVVMIEIGRGTEIAMAGAVGSVMEVVEAEIEEEIAEKETETQIETEIAGADQIRVSTGDGKGGNVVLLDGRLRWSMGGVVHHLLCQHGCLWVVSIPLVLLSTK